jgi:hypothetical protein
MSVVEDRRLGESRSPEEYPHAVNVGPIGRLGRYTSRPAGSTFPGRDRRREAQAGHPDPRT